MEERESHEASATRGDTPGLRSHGRICDMCGRAGLGQGESLRTSSQVMLMRAYALQLSGVCPLHEVRNQVIKRQRLLATLVDKREDQHLSE